MKQKRILSLLLSASLTMSLLPAFATTAAAETASEKNITLGTVALKGGQASNVYFGSYKQSSDGQGGYNIDPIKWRVLDADNDYDNKTVGETDTTRGLLLLSDQNLDVFQYHTDYEAVTWEKSTMRSWLNGYGADKNNGDNAGTDTEAAEADAGIDYSTDNFIDNAFSSTEQNAITETSVLNENNGNVPGGNNTEDQIFLLSIAEVKNVAYGFTADASKTDTRVSTNTTYVAKGGKLGSSMYSNGKGDYWWLRSPGLKNNYAAGVQRDGKALSSGYGVNYDAGAVRPSFNIDASSVLFTTPAVNGKSTTVGLQETTEYTGSDYKLTIKDSARSGFSANTTAASGNSLTVSYTNAKTGANEYISAVVVNADGEVTYYGKLANAESESGAVAVDLTGITLADTDKLYIFNEQINGDYKTDFASELKEVETKTRITLTKDKIDAWFADDSATLIAASYKGDELKDVKIIPVVFGAYTKALEEIGLDMIGADRIKAFLWTDMTALTSLCTAQEVTLTE